MAKTSIEWATDVWNPVRGCSLVSAGCTNCYAMRQAHRFSGPGGTYEGLTVLGPKGPRWTGEARFVPEMLDAPLRWKKPRRIFVNSMSDLFHEGVTNEQIAAVFGVMAACPRHTFQILTKRPGRMAEWFRWANARANAARHCAALAVLHLSLRAEPTGLLRARTGDWSISEVDTAWPLPNVWLGVSVEDQLTAELRILELLGTPAALRFVSYEPALGAVDFADLVIKEAQPPHGPRISLNAMTGVVAGPDDVLPSLDWIIVGGESGPGARPFDVEWARSTIRQGRDVGVPVFVKQIGAVPYDGAAPGEVVPNEARVLARAGWLARPGTLKELRDRKGGDWSEWPEDLRVREMPEVARG